MIHAAFRHRIVIVKPWLPLAASRNHHVAAPRSGARPPISFAKPQAASAYNGHVVARWPEEDDERLTPRR